MPGSLQLGEASCKEYYTDLRKQPFELTLKRYNNLRGKCEGVKDSTT